MKHRRDNYWYSWVIAVGALAVIGLVKVVIWLVGG